MFQFDDFIKIGQIRAKMPQYRDKKRRAIDVSAEQLIKAKSPYLSLSGGKDSVAMAFVVWEASKLVEKPFRMWTHISDASFPGTLETCQSVAERISMPLDVSESGKSAFEYLSDLKKQSFSKNGVFFDAIREYAKSKDLSFVGVRARESKRRMNAAKAHGQVFRSKSMGDVTVCHPVLYFTLEDVAAALWEYDAPIHPIYQKSPIGSYINVFGEDSFIRLAYTTSKDLLNKGTAVFLKYNYPEQFQKLAEAWPEIRLWI